MNNHAYARILDVVRDLNHTNIDNFIDLGCSDGMLTTLVAKAVNAKEVYGVDISKEALEKAALKNIKTFRGDLNTYKLPFKDNFFDLILSAAVIEYLIEPDYMLREVYRVLKPEKYFILETLPSLGSWVNRFSLMLGYQPYGCFVSKESPFVGTLFRNKLELAFPKQQFGHALRAFTLRAIKDLLKFHGFEIITVKGARGVFPKSKVITIIDSIFSKRASLARRNIILAVKPKVE